jgi:hypothetical protein
MLDEDEKSSLRSLRFSANSARIPYIAKPGKGCNNGIVYAMRTGKREPFFLAETAEKRRERGDEYVRKFLRTYPKKFTGANLDIHA